jgi:hypothetical protein
MVINFKWKQYTEGFFLYQFFKMLLFLASFIADIVMLSPDVTDQLDPDSLQYTIANIVTRAVCGLIMLDHIIYELKQMLALN